MHNNVASKSSEIQISYNVDGWNQTFSINLSAFDRNQQPEWCLAEVHTPVISRE